MRQWDKQNLKFLIPINILILESIVNNHIETRLNILIKILFITN